MPRKQQVRWGKLFGSLEDDTAHYTDAQFRAFVGLLCRAIRDGDLPKRRALDKLYGRENLDFLFADGQLSNAADDERPEIVDFDRYQAPKDPTAAKRQADYRDRLKSTSPLVDNGVDNASPTVTSRVTVPYASTSPSESSNGTEKKNGVVYPDGGDRDALDRYYELTGSRPWGKRVGAWLLELEATHGFVNVDAAMTVESIVGLDKLVDRTAARLEAQAHRVERTRVKAVRKGPPAPPAPEVTPEAIAAGRKAHEALKARWGKVETTRGGAMQAVGAVLSSANGSPDPQGPTLTTTEDSDTGSSQGQPARVAAVGSEANSFAPHTEPGVAETVIRTASADGRHAPRES